MARPRIPEPSEAPGQPRAPKKIPISFDLELDAGYMELLASSLPGEESKARKIASIALGLLEQLAEGGIMVPPGIVRKMADSFGSSPAVEDVLDLFEKGLQRKDGKLAMVIYLDPADEFPLREAAIFNGFTLPGGAADVPKYMKNLWDTAWDNGDFHGRVPGTARVLMMPHDYQALVELLGKDFENGTELAALVKEYVNQQTGLFSEQEAGV